ncbi:tetratricopeptide repeat protein [Kordia sp.]|uniref:tetratricopeptide repeat protein n=1 Tax=Kordia sp. TaxID=1965332 RepID=UPI003D6AB2DC
MKKITLIFLILTTIGCKNNTLSEADKLKVTELNNKAIELRIKGEIDKAEELYIKALEIDNTDLNIHYALVGIYMQKKEIDKAFDLLNNLPEDEKKEPYYYQAKGNVYEFDGDLKKAKENYIKAYELSEVIDVIAEEDLGLLVGYATLETFAGYKEKAVDRMNKALKLDWLTKSNKQFLESFRNEFEFYQGKGAKEFSDKDEMTICSKNIDSLTNILKTYHINVAGSSYTSEEIAGKTKKVGKIRVHKKFSSGIEKLGIKECDSK